MAENQNTNELDELLEDIALSPDADNKPSNSNDTTADLLEEDATDQFDDLLSTKTEDQPMNNEYEDELTLDEQLSPEPTIEDDGLLEEINDDNIDAEALTNELMNDVDEDDDEKEYAVQKKQSKMQKILIGIVAALVLVILTGATLYFLGMFDPEEPIEEAPKVVEKVEEQPSYKFKQKDIDVNRLNKKLNLLTKYEILESDQKELEKSMERERLYQEEKAKLEAERKAKIEKIKAIEAKKYEEQLKAQQRENELTELARIQAEEEAQKAQADALAKKAALDAQIAAEEVKESMMQNEEQTMQASNETAETKEQVEPTMEESNNEDSNTMANEMPNEDELKVGNTIVLEGTQKQATEETKSIGFTEDEMLNEEKKMPTPESMNFLKFIVIDTHKKDIYKTYLDKILNVNNEIRLCRNDKNHVEVFVGPLNDNREMLLNKFKEMLKDENPEAIDFTQEEFDKRCNY